MATSDGPNDDAHYDLRHHGDADATPGLVDLAVNVRAGMPPAWLRDRLAASVANLATYPDARPATAAIGVRHGRPADEVLPTAGGAEAFTLIARALRPGDVHRAIVVHPQFTEPEVALTTAGHGVERAVLPQRTGYTLDPAAIPEDSDLVVIGNPTNPTSVLHRADALAQLTRPGRVLVVDEAFMDAVPGETESLASRRDLPGLIVLRSLTKTWGLAGLRAGYALGPAALIERLRMVQPPWSVSSLAIEAMCACMGPSALLETDRCAGADEPVRRWLTDQLQELGGHVVPHPRAPFVLVRFPEEFPEESSDDELSDSDELRVRLRQAGWAVRRGDTFPGLGPGWMRIALRDRATLSRFLDDLARLRRLSSRG